MAHKLKTYNTVIRRSSLHKITFILLISDVYNSIEKCPT